MGIQVDPTYSVTKDQETVNFLFPAASGSHVRWH